MDYTIVIRHYTQSFEYKLMYQAFLDKRKYPLIFGDAVVGYFMIQVVDEDKVSGIVEFHLAHVK